MTPAEIMTVFRGSNGDVTRALYAKLEAAGPLGVVAVNLFRACKTSERAKVYRKGPGHKTASYARKDWSIENAARELAAMSPAPFQWGWNIDRILQGNQDPHHHVVYFDLPTGQVSFHAGSRYAGPDYPGKWDRAVGTAPNRITRWCAAVLAGRALEAIGDAPVAASEPAITAGRQESLL